MTSLGEQSGVLDGLPSGRFGEQAHMTLRARTARGTLVNGGFLVGTNAINLIKGLAVATFLTSSQYGVWGLLMAAFITLVTLGSVGINDKYIQQDHPDQRAAFEVAFTFQALLGAIFFLAVLAGMPLFALLYGHREMIAPGMTLALAVPAVALQMPLWIHYRRMDFRRQRMLQLIDPLISLVAVLALAAGGFGVWALVIGELLGTWCAAAAIVRSSPYRLRLRWEREALVEYSKFSSPLLLAALSAVLLVQVPVVVGVHVLGVVAIGGMALAGTLAQFTSRVDEVVTQTLYPAICAVKDRTDLLFESFWKSNRLALLWAAPVAGAAALFAGDFVHFGIGERWRFAVPLIVIFAIMGALNQIGFNWTAFYRARGDTRPVLVANGVELALVMAVAVPLLVLKGLNGFGAGLIAATCASVWVRLIYLKRLFPDLAPARHVAAGLAPTIPALGALLALRAVSADARTPGRVIGEAALYAALVVGATALLQRELMTEALSYLRGRPGAPAAAGPGGPPLTVVIPTLGRPELLKRVLDRLDRQSAGADSFAVVVVADAKEVRLQELDRAGEGRPYPVRLLRATATGASAARNAGWRAATTPLVLFIDDDILPSRGLVAEHLSWHGRHPDPEVGVLGKVRWAAELRVSTFMRTLEHGILFDYPSIAAEQASWGHFYTANVSVKRTLIERVDGFDEQRLPYGYEDIELALRMHTHEGFRLLYNRAAVAEHLQQMDLQSWQERIARYAVAERAFIALHPGMRAYFFEMFTEAASCPPVSPTGTRLARLVPRWVPFVGPRVWSSADGHVKQALAASFLSAWHEADHPRAATSVSSSGSSPGGPK